MKISTITLDRKERGGKEQTYLKIVFPHWMIEQCNFQHKQRFDVAYEDGNIIAVRFRPETGKYKLAMNDKKTNSLSLHVPESDLEITLAKKHPLYNVEHEVFPDYDMLQFHLPHEFKRTESGFKLLKGFKLLRGAA